MKQVLILLLLLPLSTSAQTRKFIDRALETISGKDTVHEISITHASTDRFDVLSRDNEQLEALFIGTLCKRSPSRKRLMESAALKSLSLIAVEVWKGDHYTDHRKWSKLNKYFNRVLRHSTGRFNMIKTYSFRVKLVDNRGRLFHYDRRVSEGELNLFFGGKRKKPKRIDDESEDERVPLESFTEEEILSAFMRRMRKKSMLSYIRKGVFEYAGLSVEVDERSLFRNRIPTARVVVFLGARRLKRVRPMRNAESKGQSASSINGKTP